MTFLCIDEPSDIVGAGDGLVFEDVFSGLEVVVVVVAATLKQLAVFRLPQGGRIPSPGVCHRVNMCATGCDCEE